jgi:hypothetical protein
MIEDLPSIVYLTICKIDNKGYVGVHNTDTPDVFDDYLGSGKYLKRAIKKHGKKNFIRKTILVGLESYCYFMEDPLIDLYQTNAITGHGYNIAIGGDKPPSWKGKKRKTRTPEHAKKIGDSHRGKPAHNRGKPSPLLGIPRSEEAKRNISAAKKGRPSGRKGRPSGRKGIPNLKNSENLKGRKLSIESIRKREETKKRNKLAGKISANMGKPWSEVRRLAHKNKKERS